MPSPLPIKIYLEAVAKYREGKKEEAAQLLAESLGAINPSPIMRNSIDRLLERNTMPNDVILQILSTEVSKGEEGNGGK